MQPLCNVIPPSETPSRSPRALGGAVRAGQWPLHQESQMTSSYLQPNPEPRTGAVEVSWEQAHSYCWPSWSPGWAQPAWRHPRRMPARDGREALLVGPTLPGLARQPLFGQNKAGPLLLPTCCLQCRSGLHMPAHTCFSRLWFRVPLRQALSSYLATIDKRTADSGLCSAPARETPARHSSSGIAPFPLSVAVLPR